MNITGNCRKRAGSTLLVTLVLAAVLVAGVADAGWFGKDKDKAGDREKVIPHRFNRFPTLSFKQGTLYRGAPGSWQLDDRSLQLARGCLVTEDGRPAGQLQDGRTAIVAGTVVGDQIFATHIRLVKTGGSSSGSGAEGVAKAPSEANPMVGILEQAPK